MKLGALFGYYFFWHYTLAFADIVRIWRNFLWFFYNFFSIGLLSKTFFSPLERLQEKYAGDFDIAEFISTIAVNVIMRIVGAILRFFIILVGLVTLLATLAFGIIFFLLWLILPAIVPVLFFWGFVVLFI